MFVPKGLTPCQVNDPELWFSDRRARVAAAKELCLSCEDRIQCRAETLQFELEQGGAQFGLYGGLTRAERNKIIRKKRKAG